MPHESYYQNAIEANGALLAKLRGTPGRLHLSGPSPDCWTIRSWRTSRAPARRRSTAAFSRASWTRGTIVNNNMNILLKSLTVINVIFLPLNLLASIGGMSEFTMMTHGMDWRLAYALFFLGMVVLAWVTWRVLARVMERDRTPRRRPR